MKISITTDALLEAMTCPVSQPGNPLRDPRFAEAKKEVGSAATRGIVNWQRVGELSCEVLRETGKDLTLMVYVVYIAFEVSGLSGFAQGLNAVSKLLVDGAVVSPEKPVYKRRALEWLLKKVRGVFRVLHEHKVDEPLARALRASISELDHASAQALPDQDLGLGFYRKAVREHLERLKMEKPPAPQPPVVEKEESPAVESTKSRDSEAQETKGGQSPEPTPPVGAEVEKKNVDTSSSQITARDSKPSGTGRVSTDDASTGETLSALRKQMAMHASKLREKDAANPISYRLMRAACWLEITQLPNTDANGKTALGGIQERARKDLETLRGKEKWAGVLQKCENLVLTRPYHLDLHRMTGEALAGLGFDEALRALTTELGTFLNRLPKLVDMLDKTGKPLADQVSQTWLKKHVMTSTRSPVRRVAVNLPAQTSEGSQDTFAVDADPEGLAKFHVQVRRASSERERFHLWLRLGEVMNDRGEYAFARRLFAALVGEERAFELGTWEPEVFARGLAGLARAQIELGESAEAALAKLVVLDAPRAAALIHQRADMV